MGKKANIVKDRVCMSCGQVVNTTSGGLKKHFERCNG